MRSSLECIPCFIEHAIHVAKLSSADPSVREAIAREVLLRVAEMDLMRPPPLTAREIRSIVSRHSGVHDLYLEQKDKSTEYAIKLLELLKPEAESHPDRFEAAVRLAIAGNIIDYGVDCRFELESARGKMKDAFKEPISKEGLETLRRSMEEADSILYLADNCGEAVFDRLLIEPFREKTVLVVRGKPILNDLTRRELSASGLEGLASRLVDTGDFCPGVSLEHSSEEFRREFASADMLVSKGQGNYEMLSDTDRPIVFLFRAKCKVVTRELGGVPMGSYQIIPKNIPKRIYAKKA